MDSKSPPSQDDIARIIVLLGGVLASTEPFWAYVAVKPSVFAKFQHDHKTGVLDYYNFAPYGEMVVSGEGHSPPDEVTAKVAALYKTNPQDFFTCDDPQAAIAEKLNRLFPKPADS